MSYISRLNDQNKLIKFLYNYRIEIIISIFILMGSIFIFPHIKQYSIKYHHKTPQHKSSITYYEDLNFDEKSEQIVFSLDNLGFSSLMIREGDRTHGQWIFKGHFANSFFSFMDFNNNGYKEIYVFTINNDSLFLNAIESYTTNIIIKDRFIAKLQVVNERNDVAIYVPFKQVDFNCDNSKELLFAVRAGYNFKSRGLYIYDILSDSIKKSPVGGTVFYKPIRVHKSDSNFFITTTSYQVGNTPKDYPQSDQYAWLMVFDKNLSYVFNPIKVGEYPSRTYTKVINIQNEPHFAVLYCYDGLNDTSQLLIANNKGKILNNKKLTKNIGSLTMMVNDSKEDINIYESNGEYLSFNYKLNRIAKKQMNPFYGGNYFSQDITSDSILDGIYYDHIENNYVFFDPIKLSQTIIPLDNQQKLITFSKYFDGKSTYLYCNKEGDSIFYKFKINWLYKFRYLIPIIFIVIIFGAWGLVKIIFNYYLEKRIARQNQISKLQLLNVKNQLDSHFTFNMIDCIGNNFRKNDFDTANKLFTHYTRLLQQSVQLSNEIAIPLSKEFEYIENYLALERARYNYRFNFEVINTMENELEIPKYLLFTFVENAVKHGISTLQDREGFITIKAIQRKKMAQITISDNGVGFGSNGNSKGTGNGLKIITELIRLFKSEYKLQIKYSIDKNHTPGTRVNIELNHE